MQNNLQGPKEKLIWLIAAGTALLVLLGTVIYTAVSASNLNAQLSAIEAQESKIQESVKKVEAVKASINECESALQAVDEAYDNYWSAYLGWTDEVDVMLNYGIFAADTVALIAIPQIAADGDDALNTAMSYSCG